MLSTWLHNCSFVICIDPNQTIQQDIVSKYAKIFLKYYNTIKKKFFCATFYDIEKIQLNKMHSTVL